MVSATVFQQYKEEKQRKKQIITKRKADDISDEGEIEPAAKRPATEVVKKNLKKGEGNWALAEKLGFAALGGAMVLGTLIYMTAPV